MEHKIVLDLLSLKFCYVTLTSNNNFQTYRYFLSVQ